MSWGSRVLLSCVLVASACAGDNRVDPSELELRDVLGMAPETAMAWDSDQRASARQVIDAGMHEAPPAPVHASLGQDRSISSALAVVDAGRAKQRLSAMGVVEVALERDELRATPHLSTLAPRVTSPIELELAGWDRPGWAQLPARGLDVLTTIASDAGHRGGPIIVTPAPQLAVIAAYIPATSTSAARLVVNPVLLASLEPVARTASPTNVTGAGPRVLAADPVGNPYTFYGSVEECAAAQQLRCEACLPTNTCTSISGSGDGTAECAQLAAGQGRGYSLVCINFALAIDSISSCATTSAPSCPYDPRAGESISSLQNNSDFLDRPECAGPLDTCLAHVFGPTPTSSTTPPRNTSADCADSACEASPSCDDNGCDNGGSCDDSSNSGADDGCSGDNSSGCDSSDSGGGCDSSDSGGGCGGDSGGDCSGGDSGGDCSGGGGNDCDAGGHHHASDHGYLWACLPLPFAIIARRRADRRRAKREVAP
jgi:hypothetical protein